jgi:hypothetical protein
MWLAMVWPSAMLAVVIVGGVVAVAVCKRAFH